MLGLDAAWTEDGSSGVALVETGSRQNRVAAMAPSYQTFLHLAHGKPVDWTRFHKGGLPALEDLVSAAEKITPKPVEVIAVDMPLSFQPITGRRSADRAISKAYGSRKCSTHTPSQDRPGPISAALRHEAARLGYALVTTAESRPPKALIETYPHPAILSLTGARCRIRYKVQKIAKYWPKLTPKERRSKVARRLSLIRCHLKKVLGEFELTIDDTAPLRNLKSAEDVVDALVCCWVGTRWLDGAAQAYGDTQAAIWVPHPLASP